MTLYQTLSKLHDIMYMFTDTHVIPVKVGDKEVTDIILKQEGNEYSIELKIEEDNN